MQRRGFFGRLAALLIAPVVFDQIADGRSPVATERQITNQQREAKPATTVVSNATGPGISIVGRASYVEYRATRDVKAGEITHDGITSGVAMSDISKGNWGFIQVRGPVRVRFKG